MPITQAPSPFIGVIMLDTRFFRPAGDIGQPLTFERAGIPARFHRVARATARRVVLCTSHDLLHPFMEAAQTLEQQGAALITTSCGFLARYQSELQAAVKVPVISSSLLLCQHLERPGIVTFDAASLKADVLEGASVPQGRRAPLGLSHSPSCQRARAPRQAPKQMASTVGIIHSF